MVIRTSLYFYNNNFELPPTSHPLFSSTASLLHSTTLQTVPLHNIPFQTVPVPDIPFQSITPQSGSYKYLRAHDTIVHPVCRLIHVTKTTRFLSISYSSSCLQKHTHTRIPSYALQTPPTKSEYHQSKPKTNN